jgi:hypothetical protein
LSTPFLTLGIAPRHHHILLVHLPAWSVKALHNYHQCITHKRTLSYRLRFTNHWSKTEMSAVSHVGVIPVKENKNYASVRLLQLANH